MRRFGGIAISTMIILGAVGLPSASPPPDDPNWRRLSSMPIELRRTLAGNFAQFQLLGAAEQAAIRALDDRLNAESDDVREAYIAALHRYHLWLKTLPDARREELINAPPENRLALVTKFRAEQNANLNGRDASIFPVVEAGIVSPSEVAAQAKAWLALDPKEKEEVLKLQPLARAKRLTELAKAHDLKPPVKPPLPDPETVMDRIARGRWNNMIRRAEETGKERRPDLKKDFRLEESKRFRMRIAEQLYYVEHPVQKVRADQLFAFEKALPPWLRTMFDALPPDEARQRLTVLYRLVFPFPEEYRPNTGKNIAKTASPTPAPPVSPLRGFTPPPLPPVPKGANSSPF